MKSLDEPSSIVHTEHLAAVYTYPMTMGTHVDACCVGVNRFKPGRRGGLFSSWDHLSQAGALLQQRCLDLDERTKVTKALTGLTQNQADVQALGTNDDVGCSCQDTPIISEFPVL